MASSSVRAAADSLALQAMSAKFSSLSAFDDMELPRLRCLKLGSLVAPGATAGARDDDRRRSLSQPGSGRGTFVASATPFSLEGVLGQTAPKLQAAQPMTTTSADMNEGPSCCGDPRNGLGQDCGVMASVFSSAPPRRPSPPVADSLPMATTLPAISAQDLRAEGGDSEGDSEDCFKDYWAPLVGQTSGWKRAGQEESAAPADESVSPPTTPGLIRRLKRHRRRSTQ